MKGLEFGLVQAIIATVALLLIALGLTYRRATEAASRFRIPGGGIGSYRASPGGPTQQDHSSFVRTGEDELLRGKPSPEHVRSLGLVSWEADRADRIESAYMRRKEETAGRLATVDSASAEAAGVRAELRRLADARHALLERIERLASNESQA